MYNWDRYQCLCQQQLRQLPHWQVDVGRLQAAISCKQFTGARASETNYNVTAAISSCAQSSATIRGSKSTGHFMQGPPTEQTFSSSSGNRSIPYKQTARHCHAQFKFPGDNCAAPAVISSYLSATGSGRSRKAQTSFSPKQELLCAQPSCVSRGQCSSNS